MHSGDQYGLSAASVIIDPQRLQNEAYAITHPLEVINRPAATAINQIATQNVTTEGPQLPTSWSFEIVDTINGPSAMEQCFCCKAPLWKPTTVQIANGSIICPPAGNQTLYGLFYIVEEQGSQTRITLRTQFQPFAVLRTTNNGQLDQFIQCIEASGAVAFGDVANQVHVNQLNAHTQHIHHPNYRPGTTVAVAVGTPGGGPAIGFANHFPNNNNQMQR